ncbi:hypothetical protein [Chitinilyticum aquatile]|uniref:hypothetical protein n=1 Tax=Chitinilyticum aquatile TaxID=362520 RepID=UPI00048EBEBC|nr:hypothetical protein [Chitinilyticum aquatile]
MNEEKVARICWNANKWQYPSGKAGKVASGSSGAYETKTGYGHEEWLFDVSKLVNGYHYAYIQAIGQHREKYEGEIFNISFYTINSAKKERWWLGEIHNIHVVSSDESRSVHATYMKNGWLKEMFAQLEAVGADVDEFKDINPDSFCCIKFRPEDMHLLEEPRLFSSKDPAVKSDYYNLKNKVGNPLGIEDRKFHFTPGFTAKKDSTTASYSSQKKEIDLVHNQMQEQIYEQLAEIYGKDNVSCEQETGFGTKIDVAVRSSDGYVFYELKTANTSKQCIREALAQLMEYAYYPDESRASRLIVVGPVNISHESKKYLENLRRKFLLPIYYIKYDLETKNLGSEE